ncbi:MAG TPA: class I SAM-dependent methyltransferase [Solirubrobacterales bacterium]|nr:class I SAM-dependent methyltransferase [Solirubrobacterales bacterium]
MDQHWPRGDSAQRAYETVAAFYDDFTHGLGYKYEQWTGRLLAKAEELGLEGNRLLDVGCGTGLSFLPMLERGWEVTACDVSPEMIERARAKVGDRARLVVADMRELPDLGQFDLVWAVNDPVNYLLSAEELEAALVGMRRNLAPEGIALLDASTLKTHREFFAGEIVVEEEGKRFFWTGQKPSQGVEAGGIVEARLEAEGEEGSAHVHRVRHFPEAEMLAAIEAAGLQCVGVFGEQEGELQSELDEGVHTQAVYCFRGGQPV